MKKSFHRINRQQVATKGYVLVRSSMSSSHGTEAERKSKAAAFMLLNKVTEEFEAKWKSQEEHSIEG